MLNKLENRIPPPLVAIVCALLMWWIAKATAAVAINDSLRITLVVLLWLLSAVVSVAGMVSFRRAKTTVNPLRPDSASQLVVSGIYQITRNPMYLGLALLLAAWGVCLASLWSFIGLVVFILYISRFQIVPEERALTTLFGERYLEYCRRVRRWL